MPGRREWRLSPQPHPSGLARAVPGAAVEGAQPGSTTPPRPCSRIPPNIQLHFHSHFISGGRGCAGGRRPALTQIGWETAPQAVSPASPLCRLVSLGLTAPFPVRCPAEGIPLPSATFIRPRRGWWLGSAGLPPLGARQVTLEPQAGRGQGRRALLLLDSHSPEAPLTFPQPLTQEALGGRVPQWGTCPFATLCKRHPM